MATPRPHHDLPPGSTKRPLSAAALLPLVLAACITIEGQSSGQMKKNLQNSFLFQSTDIFYPEGVPDDPEQLPRLEDRQTKKVNAILKRLLEGIKQLHARQHTRMAAIFERPLASEIEAALVLMNTGQPIAFIDPRGDVHLDIKVVQAFYRTALVAGLQDNSLFGPGFMAHGDPSPPRDERELIAAFLEVKERVQSTEGRTVLGDLTEAMGDDDFSGSWFTMTELAMTSTAVERHYFGPMQFLLAHEFAHGVLGHLEARRHIDDRDCKALHAMETEADFYALMLLYFHVIEQGGGAAAAFPDFFGMRASFGFDDFFTYTYDFSGFSREGDALCSHPDPEDRLARIETLYHALQEGTANAVWERLTSAP